jgi:hypothetical protein
MAKVPAFELIEIFQGEEELISWGTMAEMEGRREDRLEQADEDYMYNGIDAYPAMRIQPFRGF